MLTDYRYGWTISIRGHDALEDWIAQISLSGISAQFVDDRAYFRSYDDADRARRMASE